MKKLTITGHIGRDAEVRINNRGNEFATFSVAVGVGTKENPKTDWVDVVANGKLCAIAKHFVKKGSKVLVEGFPTAHGFIQDGVIHAKIRVIAGRIELLSKKLADNEDLAPWEETPAAK